MSPKHSWLGEMVRLLMPSSHHPGEREPVPRHPTGSGEAERIEARRTSKATSDTSLLLQQLFLLYILEDQRVHGLLRSRGTTSNAPSISVVLRVMLPRELKYRGRSRVWSWGKRRGRRQLVL